MTRHTKTSRTVRITLIAAATLLCGCEHPGHSVHSESAGTAAGPDMPVTPRFVDVTQAAGIHFLHQSGHSSRKYLVETMGSGCAFLDSDNDGFQDILLLNDTGVTGGKVTGSPRLALYHNNHNGTFTDATLGSGLEKAPMYAMGAAVGDYDNDGKDDLYISCVLGPSHLFHNEGGGHFRDVTAEAGVSNSGMWGASSMWVDYDHDGLLDLFVCNYVPYKTLSDDVPCYAGENRKNVYCDPTAYKTSRCSLFHNLGGGRFRDVSASSGVAAFGGKSLGVAMWDNDGSGWPDIYVANDGSATFLLKNQRNGTFKDTGAESGIAFMADGAAPSGMGIDAGDPYNDGSVCLVMTNFQGRRTLLFHQTQPGVFQDEGDSSGIGDATSAVLGFGVLFFDFDNDGRQDIAQVDGHVIDDVAQREPSISYAQPTLLFRNLGGHRFAEVGEKSGAPFTRKLVGRGLASGDIDNSGKVDLVIAQNNGPALLWRNETATSNHWLTLKLIGGKSNRDGIGALITLRAGGVSQRQLVHSGSSYCSQSDLRAHFGLGNATSASAEVKWPSGVTDSLNSLACDRLWTVREGTGQAQ